MLILPLIASVVAASAPADIVTTAPLDTLQRCMAGELSRTGRAVAINSASGVVLDVAFQSVAVDGKVATGHLTFAIDDLGTQRRITATATTEADAPIAQQLLRETAKACIGESESHIAE